MTKTDSIESVGRIGHLLLEYERQAERTILARSRCNSPWNLLPAIELDDSGAAYTVLLNPSGGLVGGDRLQIQARLGPDCHVLISTPSANRVYRSTDAVAVQSVQIHVGAGARLEWVPDLTIPFHRSRFQQQISVTHEPGATVLCWDALASGRVARGERWSFSSFENEIRIAGPTGVPIVERFRLHGGAEKVGLVTDWDYVGSLYMTGDGISTQVWKELEERAIEALDDWPGRVLAGVSEPSGGGRVVKILARGASELQAAFEAVWQMARERLWGLPAPALRRY
jgi:urease accessory protein